VTANPKGSLIVSADGQEYTLFIGMSVLADLQAKHGQDVLEKLDAPKGSDPNWMPELGIVIDLFLGALQRHHADTATRWVVDDIIAENSHALVDLMRAAFPEAPKASVGNRKSRRAAA